VDGGDRAPGREAVKCAVRALVYTHDMTERAKIFASDGSQVVRLPKSMEFPDDLSEVRVRRVGNIVILEAEPVDEEWSPEFLASLGSWDEEIERPPSRPITEMKDPFE